MARPALAPKPRIGVLCSGHGTNLQAILDAVRSGRLRAQIAIVISDRSDARALERASQAGIEAVFIDPKAHPSRQAFDQALADRLQAAQVKLVCLAGFMRILSPVFVQRFAGRILNVHPALLPAFPGANGIRDALSWGVKVTGVTVHLVDEAVDHGPIVLQEAVPVGPKDTESTVLKKLHAIEHKLFPQAIQLMLDGRIRLDGRCAVIRAKR